MGKYIRKQTKGGLTVLSRKLLWSVLNGDRVDFEFRGKDRSLYELRYTGNDSSKRIVNHLRTSIGVPSGTIDHSSKRSATLDCN